MAVMPNPLGLQNGDVVSLSSGGPSMTLLEIYHGGENGRCGWFANMQAQTLSQAEFPLISLRRA
jgi:uncharacterized protein YodC (DUF2158 family)